MNRLNLWIVTLCGILCIACCDLFLPAEETEINVDEEILAEMEAMDIPSVTACIIQGDSIVWRAAYGLADVQADIPATTNTIYTLMSVSKLIIATAVMQLWEQDLIDLDADVGDYLPFPVRNPNFP